MAKQDDPMKELIPFDYIKFRDKAELLAKQRGAQQPEWEDVWQAFIQNIKGGELLREMQVDTAELQYDLAYSALYGRPKQNQALLPANAADQRATRNGLIAELIADMDAFLATIRNADATEDEAAPDRPQGLQDLRTDFIAFSRYISQMDSSAHGTRKLELLGALGETFVSEYRNRGGYRPQYSHNPHVNAVKELQAFLEGRMVAASLAQSPLDAIEESLSIAGKINQSVERVTMNPAVLFEVMLDQSGPYYQYLLARNGMVMDEHYQPEFAMPSRAMCRLGLQANTLADGERDASIVPLHFARLLLENPAIQTGIRELIREEVRPREVGDAAGKAPDPTVAFTDATAISERMSQTLSSIREQTRPRSSGDERFRKHIRVSPAALRVLDESQTFSKANPDASEVVHLFGTLLAEPEVADLLKNAGIKPETIARWSEIQDAYYAQKNALKDKKDTKVGDDPSRFKVSDEELDALFKSYGRDLTKAAAQGTLSPMIGRTKELEQVQEILLRKGKRNAILLGEPGVGKTALFEGFAQRVVSGNVPQKLLGARVVEIDLQAMNAGAMFRGQFEERLKGVVDGVAERNASGKFPPIVLCIDELHAAMQAGTASGTPGASEMMKPALTRGDLLVIGSTTESEYRKHIAKDGALSRRFEPVIVPEPDRADTLTILKGIVPSMQAHHGIEIPEHHLDELTRLTGRYVPGHSPDKDISTLDVACAKAAAVASERLERPHVLASVAQKGRLPVDFLMRDDNEKALALPQILRDHVFGQEKATDAVAAAVIKAKAGLQDPDKPIASFLFRGPTGVGKTETAKALAIHEFGSEDALIRIDMGEYAEQHSVSRLLGAPPGYIGHDEEGQLTAAVSRRPHSVILLDEVEKAHPKVFDALLAMLDDGRMTDGQGRTIDFRNTIIIMTTNHPDPKKLFRPEMLNRIDAVIPFNSLPREIVFKLIDRQLEKLESRMKDQFGCELQLSAHAKEQLAVRGYQPEYGARPLNRAVDQYVTGPLSPWLLRHQGTVRGKVITVNDIDAFAPEISDQKVVVMPTARVANVTADGTAINVDPATKKIG